VRIEKGAASVEGSPSGWDRIDGIRISAWRAQDRDTAFYVADMDVVGRDAPVLVIRADAVTAEAKSVAGFTRNVVMPLRTLGVAHRTVGDNDVRAETLAGCRVAVLPYNPFVPPAALQALEQFVREGGKLICFYLLPAALEDLTGFRRGEHARQRYSGFFASMRRSGAALPGMPDAVQQTSWNIQRYRPLPGRGTVAAAWYSGDGSPTGEPAVLVSDNCILVTHVLTSEDPANKQRMLLAMAGRFVPEVWEAAADRALERVGVFGPFARPGEAEKAIAGTGAGSELVREALSESRRMAAEAAARRASGDFREAVRAADAARAAVIRAYCATRRPQRGERRAFWCHEPFGAADKTWDEAAADAARNGFTALIANMAWGGTAYYPSRVLSTAPSAAKKGDQIEACLSACRAQGLECHVWKVCWNMGARAPDDFVARMKREGRLQRAYDGRLIADWLCPSHPDNRRLEIDAMVEIAANYAVDGIHMDYIRYPDEDACFCDGCRARFEARLGREAAGWPRSAREGALREEWLAFRRGNITALVSAVSREARRARPGLAVSAAVFPDWRKQRDSIGQDWGAWCRDGLLDFVCPMNYDESTPRFEGLVADQLGWAGRARCYPGIGLSTWTSEDRICRLIEQVEVTRRLRTGGFAVFEYNGAESREILPLCGLGLTRRETEDGAP